MPFVNCSDGPPLDMGTPPATPLERLYASVCCMVDELEQARAYVPPDANLEVLRAASVNRLATFSTALLTHLERTDG